MECYSAIKKNKILPFAERWIDLESSMLSEISQRQIFYFITYMWNLKNKNEYTVYSKTETDSENKIIDISGEGGAKIGAGD